MSFPDPGRTITVEPVEEPAQIPDPSKAPEQPVAPEREPEKVPA
jgi:hypothetical protein